jgi:monoamine oxidase/predicted heme/steroid binding protein
MPKTRSISKFDYLIAGGGIAGLYTAYCIVKNSPSARICILEAGNRLGGRLHSIPLEEGIVIEAGGARFNSNQHRIITLIRELGLDSKKVEISGGSKYIPIHRNYDSHLETIFPEIDNIIEKLATHIRQHKIPESKLIKTNLLELIDEIYSTQYPTIKKYLVARYPYYSELHSLNALEGLSLFTHEFSQKMKYFILAGGFEQLITTISHQLEKYSNVEIHLNQPLEAISHQDTKPTPTPTPTPTSRLYSISSQDKKFLADRIILALPQSALKKIKFLTKHPTVRQMINSINPEPLYRIYARYPLDKKTGKVWFAELPKIVSNLPIKYIIPSNKEKGIIMISYTDSRFARYWFDKLTAEDNILQDELARQLKLLFPELDIPSPIWLKHYYWDMGAGYWKPGCSHKEIIPHITQPLEENEIYICNENYSSHQAWVEGSLESAEYVLEKLSIPLKNKSKNINLHRESGKRKHIIPIGSANNKKTKKWRTYTLEEVEKHNRKSDAWIVIDGKVADITKWIPKHPGGNIIMKGVGKDASKLFASIGHDNYAKNMFTKYQIGTLI